MVLVRRCRFVPWKPSTIVSLAFSRNDKAMSVARENGNIEIWEKEGKGGQRWMMTSVSRFLSLPQDTVVIVACTVNVINLRDVESGPIRRLIVFL